MALVRALQSGRRSHLARKKKRSYRMLLESLEDRRLLTADVQWDPATGDLTISGSEENDWIAVSAVNGEVSVTGATPGATIPATDVTTITVLGGAGDDAIDLSAVDASTFDSLTSVVAAGEDGNDSIVGTELGDTLSGGSGTDAITGLGGTDVLQGGDGSDVLRGGEGDDSLDGGEGSDYLYGQDGIDVIEGAAGHDILSGGADGDEISGGEGDDLLMGGAGEDTIWGGAGQDSLEITDNEDAAFSSALSGQQIEGTGVNGSQYFLQATDGDEEAAWLFQSLPMDAYEVFISWETPPNLSVSDAVPVAVLGSDGVSESSVDQSTSAVGPIAADQAWHSLGIHAVTDGVLEVGIGVPSDGAGALADAVRIVPQGTPEVGIKVKGAATLSVDAISGTAAYTLALDDAGLSVDEWHIDWGDGSQTTVTDGSDSITHAYANLGEFSITATAMQGGVALAEAEEDVLISHPVGVNLLTNTSLATSEGITPGESNVIESIDGWELGDGSHFLVYSEMVEGEERRFLQFADDTTRRVSQTFTTIPGVKYYFGWSDDTVDTGTDAFFAVDVRDSYSGQRLGQSRFSSSEFSEAQSGFAFVATGDTTTVDIALLGLDPGVIGTPTPDPEPDVIREPFVTQVHYATSETTEVVLDNLFRERSGSYEINRFNGTTLYPTHEVSRTTPWGASLTLGFEGQMRYDPGVSSVFKQLRDEQDYAYDKMLYKERPAGSTGAGSNRMLVVEVSGRNTAPVVGALTVHGGRALENEPLTLRMVDASDVDGDVDSAYFFRDSDGDGFLSRDDELVGIDWVAEDGLQLTLAAGEWETEARTYFAHVVDNLGSPSGFTRLLLDEVSGYEPVLTTIGADLIVNGGFETPSFPSDITYLKSANSIPGWNRFGPSPDIEIQRERNVGADVWVDAEDTGDQWLELDTRQSVKVFTFGGQGGGASESTSLSIFQDVTLDAHHPYKLTFNFAARPGTGFDNALAVDVLESSPFTQGAFEVFDVERVHRVYKALDDTAADGIDWVTREIVFTPQSPDIRIMFSDVGNPDEVGTFLDAVSLVRVAQPTVSIDFSEALVATEEDGVSTFEFRLDQPSDRDVWIHYRTVPGTAAEVFDYVPQLNERAIIPAGELSVEVDVELVDDMLLESAESFRLDFGDVSNATVEDILETGGGDGTGDGGINDGSNSPDEEQKIKLLPTPATVSEGDAATATYELSLLGGVEYEIDVFLSATPGQENGATPNADFVLPGHVRFAAFQTSAEVEVSIIDDLAIEPTEVADIKIDGAFVVGSSPQIPIPVVPGFQTQPLEIRDNEPPPPLLCLTGGGGGSEGGSVDFKVQLDGRLVSDSVTVPVDFNVGGGTAGPGDYEVLPVDIELSNNRLSQTVTVDLIRDTDTTEPVENFTASIATTSGAVELNGCSQQQTGTISPHPDDVILVKVVPDERGGEAGPDPKFKVYASPPIPAGYTINVLLETEGGSATEDVDFQGYQGGVTLNSTNNEVVVSIAVHDDLELEGNETFQVAIVGSDSQLEHDTSGPATLSIEDDDFGNSGNDLDIDDDEEEADEDGDACCDCPCDGDTVETKDGEFSRSLGGDAAGISYHSSAYSANKHQVQARVTLDSDLRKPESIRLRADDSPDFGFNDLVNIDTTLVNPGDSFVVTLELNEFDSPGEHIVDFELMIDYGNDFYDVVSRSKRVVQSDSATTDVVAAGFAFDFAHRLWQSPDAVTIRRGDFSTWRFDAVGDKFIGTSGNYFEVEEVSDLRLHLIGLLGNGQSDLLGNGHQLTFTSGNKEIYDSDGRYRLGISRHGHVTDRVFYDVEGRVSTRTDEAGRTTTYHYDATGLDFIEDFTGTRITNFERSTLDGDDTLLITYPAPSPGEDSPSELFVLNRDGQVLEHHNVDGTLDEFSYDTLGFLESISTFNGPFEVSTRSFSTGTSQTMAPGISPWQPPVVVGDGSHVYESQVTDELGYTTTYKHDSFGNVVEMVDALGNVYTYVRDEHGNVVDEFTPDPNDFVSNSVGAVTTAPVVLTGGDADPIGRLHTHYDYDDYGNLLSVTHADQTIETWTYDPEFHQMTSHTDAEGRVTTYHIDPDSGVNVGESRYAGTASDIGDPAFPWQNPVNRFDVNNDGYVDGDDEDEIHLGFMNMSDYVDSTGRFLDRTQPQFQSAPYFDVDTVGSPNYFSPLDLLNVGTFLDLNDNGVITTSVSYTAASDRVPAGMMKSTTDGRGLTTRYFYYDDPANVAEYGQLEQVSYSHGASIKYTYDSNGNMDTMTDELGFVTNYTYDNLDRLETVLGPPQETGGERPLTSYTYFDDGSIKTVTDPLQRVTAYGYDEKGRLVTTIEDFTEDSSGKNVSSFTLYDASGRARVSVGPVVDGNSILPPYLAYRSVTITNYDPLGNVTSTIGPFEGDVGGRFSWQNPIDPRDVNGDGYTYANHPELGELDLQAIDDFLGTLTLKSLPSVTADLANVVDVDFAFYDVDGDGKVNANDRIVAALPDSDPGIPATESVFVEFSVHDRVGNTIAQVDANGNVTQYRYDERNRQTHVILENPDGASPTSTITLGALPDRAVHPTTEYSYDNAGQVEYVIDARNNTTQYEYDRAGRLVRTVLPEVDGYDVATDETTSFEPTTTFEYDKAGNRTRMVDSAGRATDFEYELDRNLLRAINAPPSGYGEEALTRPRTEYFYDRAGRVRLENTDYNRSTETIYDGHGNVAEVRMPAPNNASGRTVLGNSYDLLGNRISQTDARGTVTEFRYDRLNRLQFEVGSTPDQQTINSDPNLIPALVGGTRPVTEYSYDDSGLLRVIDPPVGGAITFDYDVRGLLTYSNQNDNYLVQVYDDVGNMLNRSEGLSGGITHFRYDRLNRQTETLVGPHDPAQQDTISKVKYDLVGNRERLIDGRFNEWVWTYDAMNRVESEDKLHASNATLRTFKYDHAHNIAREREGVRTTLYEYDELNRLRVEEWHTDGIAQTQEITLEYDLLGRLTSSSDDFHDYTFEYDSLDNVDYFHVTLPHVSGTITLDSDYNLQGSRRSLEVTHNSNSIVTNTFGFDWLNRTTSILQQSGVGKREVVYNHDLGSRLQDVSRYSDDTRSNLVAWTNFDYDGRQLSDLNHHYGPDTTSSVVAGYSFDYDSSNRLQSMIFADAAYAGESIQLIEYDWQGQLTHVRRDSSSPNWDEEYEYDLAGNREQTLIDGSYNIYQTSDFNKLDSDNDYDYEYQDFEGNLTGKNSKNGGPDITYRWDHRGRLVEVLEHPQAGNSETVVKYEYDAFNQLVRRVYRPGQPDEVDTAYVYDNGQVVLELNPSDADASVYLWGPGTDQLVAKTATTGSADETLWALTDQQGTVRDWVDDSQQIVEHLAYNAFGQRTNPSSVDAALTEFGYTGRMFDHATGLQNNLNRWYDAATGRWLSEDPIGFAAEDSNLYRYVGNSPTNAIDPTGLVAASFLPGRTEYNGTGPFAFYWDFKLDNPAAEKGYLVQEVTTEWYMFNCKTGKTDRYTKKYYEAWEVGKGDSYHQDHSKGWTDGAGFGLDRQDTRGWFKQTGVIKFFYRSESGVLGPYNGWRPGNAGGVPDALGLLSTEKQPFWWNKNSSSNEATATRSVHVKWDYTCGKQIETHDVRPR